MHPDHATAVIGTYTFTQVYERAKAIQMRYQSSDRHGVIHCINKLMTAKMTAETVAGAHAFTVKSVLYSNAETDSSSP